MFSGGKDEPAGETWTLLCVEAHDQNRVANADALADALRRVKQLDASQVSIVHGPGVSRITYGTYTRQVDPASGRETFGQDFQRDLRTVRSLATGQTFPFASARPVPKPTPDAGRPEWEISNCPGVYTLQVGVFYNAATFGTRKATAAEWAEILRGEGVEAYYHHGEVRSSVTVGHFGEQDVIREQVGPKFTTQGTRVRYSDRVEAYRKQPRFKYNLENGREVKRIRRTPEGVREVYQESFLISVPKKRSEAMSDAARRAGGE